MPLDALITLALIILMVGVLLSNRFSATAVIFSCLLVLVLLGILSPQEAVAGFSNLSLFIIAALFIIVGAMQHSGGLNFLIHSLLGPQTSYPKAMAKLLFPVAFFSAFFNNTSIVLIFTDALRKWAVKNNFAPSKFLIPLSYAAILGGSCTLIGTTTNLVMSGMLIQNGFEPLGMFELSFIGVPAALIGCLFLIFTGHFLLPNRKDPLSTLLAGDHRDYAVEAIIGDNCPLIGLTIQEANLRHLSGLYLAKIERAGRLISPVSPDEILKKNDRLIFVGIIHLIQELREIPNLKLASDVHFSPQEIESHGVLVEAVVSHSSPILNKTIRESNFRSLYNAVVLAVHRNGERIESKIGDIHLRAGDTLLLETHSSFTQNHQHSRDFYLASKIDEKKTLNLRNTTIIGLTLLVIILLGTIRPQLLFIASLLAIPFLRLVKCLNLTLVQKAIDWQILVLIASAFGIGKALEVSGAAGILSQLIVGSSQLWGPLGLLIGFYIATLILTALMTNVAAVAIVFPLIIAAVAPLGLDPRPFIIAATLGASASFATPIGYQCNLIVYGPGGYRFTDFLKIGIPLNIVVGVTTVLLIGWYWKFF